MASGVALVTVDDGLTVAVRRAGDADTPIILSSWKQQITTRPPGSLYYDPWAIANTVCDRLLRRCGAVVACNPDDLSQVLAWVCADIDANIAHFVYVSYYFRRKGLAKLLLSALEPPIKCTHWTPHARRLASLSPEFDPILVLGRHHEPTKKECNCGRKAS